MRTIKLTLAYDGTDFVGWQRQAEGVSVQGLVEAALAPIDGRPVSVIGAGRTDAGVHAEGQVASFALEHPLPVDSLVRALNARLPEAIRILAAEEMPPGFHARYSARSKTYRYRIFSAPIADPFTRRFAWHVTDPLDVASMIDAFRRVEGRHDFSAFQASGSEVGDTVRTVTRAAATIHTVEWLRGRIDPAVVVTLELSGDGFLRHMVRGLVGTVLEVAKGRRSPTDVDALLAGAPRGAAGPTAPAHGLCLVRIAY